MFTIEGTIPWPNIELGVRETTLLHPRNGEVIYPYKDAEIQLTEIAYTDVALTSLYVLRENLATQTALAADIAIDGYNPLDLEGGLLLADDTGKRVWLVPPIVEATNDAGQYVLDGAHRTSIGRWQGRTHFMAIHISGIPPDYPAYALPNTWDELRIVETVPSNPAEKKRYRGSYKELYRDFSTLNGSRMREV